MLSRCALALILFIMQAQQPASACVFAQTAAQAVLSGMVELVAPQAAIWAEASITPPQRARGLMGRKNLDRHQGMLFLFNADTPQRFWMKNTHLSLDLVFLDCEGHVTSVIRHAQPDAGQELPILTGFGSSVLELPANEAAMDGLYPGVLIRVASGRLER